MRKSTFTPEYDAFCRLMIQIREEAGFSQHQLAKRLGTRQEWVSRYEAGQRRLDIIQVWRVCQAVGVEPAQFMQKLNRALAEIVDQKTGDREEL